MTTDGPEGKQEQAAAPRTDGISAVLRRITASGMELLQVRAELFSTELEAEKLRLFATLVQALLALILLAAGLAMFSLCVLLLVPEAWRWLAALALGLVYLGFAWWSWCRARAHLSPVGGAFGGSLAELKRDRSVLEP
jgi:uncharacterized membrane protein YqjE